MVPLLRDLGLSSASQSASGIKLRWLGPFLPARVPSHFHYFLPDSPSSVCAKLGASFCNFHLSLDVSAGAIPPHPLCPFQKKKRVGDKGFTRLFRIRR